MVVCIARKYHIVMYVCMRMKSMVSSDCTPRYALFESAKCTPMGCYHTNQHVNMSYSVAYMRVRAVPARFYIHECELLAHACRVYVVLSVVAPRMCEVVFAQYCSSEYPEKL